MLNKLVLSALFLSAVTLANDFSGAWITQSKVSEGRNSIMYHVDSDGNVKTISPSVGPGNDVSDHMLNNGKIIKKGSKHYFIPEQKPGRNGEIFNIFHMYAHAKRNSGDKKAASALMKLANKGVPIKVIEVDGKKTFKFDVDKSLSDLFGSSRPLSEAEFAKAKELSEQTRSNIISDKSWFKVDEIQKCSSKEEDKAKNIPNKGTQAIFQKAIDDSGFFQFSRSKEKSSMVVLNKGGVEIGRYGFQLVPLAQNIVLGDQLHGFMNLYFQEDIKKDQSTFTTITNIDGKCKKVVLKKLNASQLSNEIEGETDANYGPMGIGGSRER